MKYLITCLHDDEYAYLKPTDPASRYQVTIEAKSKAEAVINLHKERGMVWQDAGTKNVLPIVWEIQEYETKDSTASQNTP